MHRLEELKAKLMEELETCARKELTMSSLDMVDKLSHALKSVSTIIEMESFKDGSSFEGMSGARGRGRYAKRDSMGRYADGEGGTSRGYYDGTSRNSYNSSYGRYGKAEAKEELIEQLKEIEMGAQDEETRRTIQKFIRQAEAN